MTKNKQSVNGQGPETGKPELVLVEEKKVREVMERDMKAARDLLHFVLSTPALLDMVASYATGIHNNRVEQELQAKE